MTASGPTRRRVCIGLAASSACAVALFRASDDRAAVMEPVDTDLASLRLPLLLDRGGTFDPIARRGRPWLLNVWASWCAPCVREHALWREIVRVGDLPSGVALVGLAHRDDPRDAREWLLRHGNPFAQVLVDADARARSPWAHRGVPATWMLDAEGAVCWHQAGVLTADMWRTDVMPRLGLEMGRHAAPAAALDARPV